MDGFQTAFLTAGISTVLSIISSLITAKVTRKMDYNNDIRKEIRDKRAELYLSFYNQVESVLKDRTLIFSQDYFDMLISIKPKIKLLSSKETFQAYYEFYEYVRNELHQFKKFCEENDPHNDLSRYDYFSDENGNEQETIYICNEDLLAFDRLQEKYKSEHKPDSKTVVAYIETLYQSMRNDLGSNL